MKIIQIFNFKIDHIRIKLALINVNWIINLAESSPI